MKHRPLVPAVLLAIAGTLSPAAEIKLPLVPSEALFKKMPWKEKDVPASAVWLNSRLVKIKDPGRPLQTAASSVAAHSGVLKAPSDLQSPRYGVIPFGTKEKQVHYSFIVDEPEDGPWRLFVDANANGDLTDDPPAAWRRSDVYVTSSKKAYQGFGSARLPLPAPESASLVQLNLQTLPTSDPRRDIGDVRYFADYARAGQVELGGKKYFAMLYDERAGGDFREEHVTFNLDLNEDGAFEPRGETFSTHKPFNIAGTTYEIAKMTAAGESFNIEKSDKSVEETLPIAVIEPGRTAPAFQATTHAGEKVSMPATYKGRIVLLDFWMTNQHWLEELNDVFAAYGKHHENGFEVLGVSLHTDKPGSSYLNVLKGKTLPWPQIHDGKGLLGDVAQKFSVKGGTYVLIDGTTGRILFVRGLMGPKLSVLIDAAMSRKLTPDNAVAYMGAAELDYREKKFNDSMNNLMSRSSLPPPPKFDALETDATGSKWMGKGGFTLEFKPGGVYQENWYKSSYPGVWKQDGSTEVMVTRKDGWKCAFRPTPNGGLRRVWISETGEEENDNLIFTREDSTAR